MKKIIIGIIMIYLTTPLLASDNAGAFLEKVTTARQSALNISFNEKPTLNVERRTLNELSLTAYQSFETQYYRFWGQTQFDDLTLGLGVVGASVDGMKDMDYNNLMDRWIELGKNFGYQGNAVLASVSKPFTSNLSLELTTKLIREQMNGYYALGFGADIGVLYQMDSLSLGMNLQNILSPQLKWNTPSENVDSIPPALKTEVGLTLSDQFLIVSETTFKQNRPTIFGLGVEYTPIPSLAIRGGFETSSEKISNLLNQLSHIENISAGLGLNLDPFNIDISWNTGDMSELDPVYKVTLGGKF